MRKLISELAPNLTHNCKSYRLKISPVGGLGIFTGRGSAEYFLGFEFRKSVFFGVLLRAAVFLGLLDKCCIFKCFIFLTVLFWLKLYILQVLQ